jgi:methionine-rich copper-binding protein CopC
METIETTTRNPVSARRIRAALAAVAVAAATLWPGSSSARAMAVVESYPMVNQIMDGEATSFVLRFDGPIDHASARLTLTTPTGQRSLKVRLGSQPSTLFAAVGKLTPGAYSLTWRAKARW